jgi:DNA-binding SARP family transcriptional activator
MPCALGAGVGVDPRPLYPVMASSAEGGEVRICLLGELQVARGGEAVALPASKRTRALLGYLVATRTPQTRQTLCDLLWDGPDDPRGALRWSLSKLRDVIDDAAAIRLRADRERVGFVADRTFIDVDRVHTLVDGSPEQATLGALAEAAALLKGEFLDGLDLPSCHRFHHWCMAERERLGTVRRRVLGVLLDRLQNDPQQALPYARALVAADPLSEPAHAALIRLLAKAGRQNEAEAHCQRASEMLRHEVGTAAAEAVRAALREARRKRPSDQPTVITAPPVNTGQAPVRARQDWRAELVGREAERRRITAAAAGLFADDPPRPLMFVGAPGIGKTRLLEALAAEARARGAHVASARCYEAEIIRPYGCFIDALRGLPADMIPDELRSDLLALWTGPRRASDPGDRDRLLAGIAMLTQSLAEAQPLVLIIDDLQWLDEASASLFHFLARSAIPRLLLAGAARAGEIEDNAWAKRLVQSLVRDDALEQVPVGALDAQQTAALMGLDPQSEEAVAAFRYSSGNPLLALELARARQHGADVRGQRLDGLIADQLARLSDPERELVVWAATIGREFRPELLGACLGVPEGVMFGRLERLERLGLLRPTANGYFDFAHDLVRQGVYRLQSQPHRRFLHRQIARALSAVVEDDPSLYGDLVLHAGLAEDHLTAVRACIAAGERCLRLFANTQADETAERGLAHLAHLPAGSERIRLHIGLLGVKVLAGVGTTGRDHQALLDALERAIDAAVMAGLYGDATQALSLVSTLHLRANDMEGAHQACLRAEKISRTADTATRCRQLASTGCCLLRVESSVPRALALISEAEAMAEAQNLSFVELEMGRALVAHWRGDLDVAAGLLARAMAFAALREDRYRQTDCAMWLASLALERGDYDEVEARCDELERTLGQMDRSRVPIVGALRALAGFARSQADADALLQGSVADLRAVDDKALLAFVLNTFAALSLRAGICDRAQAAAIEALAAASALHRATEIAVANAILASVAAAAGDQRNAEAHLEAARRQGLDGTLSARARRHLEYAAQAVSERWPALAAAPGIEAAAS